MCRAYVETQESKAFALVNILQIDENDKIGYCICMKKVILTSISLVTCLSLGSVANACDMHGGGFMNFNAMHSATWSPYSPEVSTTDPAFANQSYADDEFKDDIMARALNADRQYRTKAKPSFSNAAHSAAMTAQMRFAKRAENREADRDSNTKTETKDQTSNSDS